ncbi:ABC transporter ATP-binding protein [bacterium]
MNVFKRMISYMKPYIGRFMGALFCMIGVALLTSFLMWLIKPMMNNIFAERKVNMIIPIGIAIIFSSFLKGIFIYMQAYVMSFIGQKIVLTIRNQVFQHLTELSMDFYARQSTGKIMSRITNDITLIQTSLTNVPANIVRDGCTIIALTGLAFFLNWKLAIIAFFVFPIAIYPVTQFGRKLRRVSIEGQTQMAHLYTILHETVTGMKIIKAFGLEKMRANIFNKENGTFFAITMRSMRVTAMSSPIMEFIGALGISSIIVIGGYQVVEGPMTQGDFFAFIGAIVSLYNPVRSLSNLNNTIQQSLAASERVFRILDIKPTIIECENPITLEKLNDKIEYKNVNFCYVDGIKVLNNINLSIKKGEMIALVGPSGGGKSTLINVLPRFYDINSGEILIDGKSVKDISISSLRKRISIVTQEISLFNESVRENISFGDINADFGKIIEASKIAHADEFIEKMPDKYDTIVGEHGIKLSGGQRQRISIARAILKDPDILILDEATSALDSESERFIQAALEKLVHNKTMLVVAHRLSTIRQADRVVVIDKGEIVEQGTHDDLLRMKGLYAKLHHLQFNI